MQVLGLDIASSCGVSLVDRARPPSTWRCLAIESEGDAMEEAAADLAGALWRLLRPEKIDFAAIEMPLRSIAMHEKKDADGADGKKRATINPATAMKINQLTGAAVAVLELLGVPWGLIPVATWRSVYYGRGVRAASKDEWKRLAVQAAGQMGVPLPVTQKAARDAAEALGVAMSWASCTFVPARHRQAFMDLRLGRRRGEAA